MVNVCDCISWMPSRGLGHKSTKQNKNTLSLEFINAVDSLLQTITPSDMRDNVKK